MGVLIFTDIEIDYIGLASSGVGAVASPFFFLTGRARLARFLGV
jgi:hypothetical protein